MMVKRYIGWLALTSHFLHSCFIHVSRLRACGPVIPGILSLQPESVQLRYVSGHYGDSVRYGDEYYFLLLLGRRALTSQEGGRPCLLGTFNYGVAGHLAFRLTQREY